MNNRTFFLVSHNTSNTRGFPLAYRAEGAFRRMSYCSKCSRDNWYADGDIKLHLEKDKGVKWPDVLGSGFFPLLLLSARAEDIFRKELGLILPAYKATIQLPIPKGFQDSVPPQYFWIDGQKMQGASLDFSASGFVDVKFCSECGTRSDDVSKTYERQSAPGHECVFKAGSWSGADIFTTEISPTQFFCTDRFVQCAKKHKLTNFQFVTIESGFSGQPVKYM